MQDYLSVIGLIEDIRFDRHITAKKDKKEYSKFKVIINGENYDLLVNGLTEECPLGIGEENEWHYALNHWTDKLGVAHTDRNLFLPRPTTAPQKPTQNLAPKVAQKKPISPETLLVMEADQLKRIEEKVDKILHLILQGTLK